MSAKIKKGDFVIILTGKDKGKRGTVLSVFPKISKVLVEGVNQVKRHTKPQEGSNGGIITKFLPIHLSNVALLDPKDQKPVRIGFKFENNKKIRYAKRSGDVVPN